ncbi:ISL3 family transposase [Anoxybacillus flavithermus]
MLSISLELPEFEVIKQLSFSNQYFVHVQKKCHEERCPYCGFMTSYVHDRRTRKVRDLPILNHSVCLFVLVKRYQFQNCQSVFSESYESIQPNKHQTNRYREYLFELCQDTTIQDVSRKQKIPYSTLERIYYSVAQEKAALHQKQIHEALDKDELVLSLDEVSVRKGHRYETVLTEAKLGCVIGMHKDRDCDSTIQLFNQNVLSSQTVQTIVLDMCEPYHKAIQSVFPLATIVIDKYHVVQKVTQALDKVRKRFAKLKKARFLLLKGYESLQDYQKARLEEILEEYPELACAYYLKELFRDFYKLTDYDDAHDLLEEWIQLARNSPYSSFHKVANTLEKWKAPILQYFLSPYTNARTEGTNHKIKNIKRRAYGYRNLKRFRLRVFLECTGNTNFDQIA